MKLLRTPSALTATLLSLPPSAKTGLVPTMGSLHAGHMALVSASLDCTDFTLVSIFINPTQFAPGEDLASYPRQQRADLDLLRRAGVHAVFAPAPGDVYPDGYSTYVTTGVGEPGINPASEGARRPGMFRGVATVVTKLLVLARPDVVFFGRKDAQQCAVVRRLCEDLWLGMRTRVACVDTVREKDGLAMSSRNVYLGEAERRGATVLYRALCAGRRVVEGGERKAKIVKEAMKRVIDDWREGDGREVDFDMGYISVCGGLDVQEIEGEIKDGMEVLACVAARFGKARLIDNVMLCGC